MFTSFKKNSCCFSKLLLLFFNLLLLFLNVSSNIKEIFLVATQKRILSGWQRAAFIDNLLSASCQYVNKSVILILFNMFG